MGDKAGRKGRVWGGRRRWKQGCVCEERGLGGAGEVPVEWTIE